MSIISYISNLCSKLLNSGDRRIQEDIEHETLRINEKIRETRETASLWNPDAFEHDIVFTQQYLAEAERFTAKLSRKGRDQDAKRLNGKIVELRRFCDEVRQRYQE